MHRTHRIFALLAAALLLLTACSVQEAEPEAPAPAAESTPSAAAAPADDAAVAGIGERAVTWAQYRMTFDTYLTYYQEMGFDVFASEERLRGFQERTVEALLQPNVLAEQAAAQGYDRLDAAAAAALEAEIEASIASLGSAYEAQVAAELAANPSLDTEARTKELIAAESYYYTGISMDYESYIDWIANYLREQAYVEAMRAATIADVAISDAEVEAAYEKQLQADQSAYTTDPGAYRAAAAGTIPPLYVPGGYSRVLVLSFPGEDLSADAEYTALLARMAELQTAYGELALNAAYTESDSAEALAAIEAAYATVYANQQAMIEAATADAQKEAEQALAALDAGAAFETLSMDTQAISLLYTDAQDWSDAVKSAFAALAPGQYSPIIRDARGCTILYYLEDIPEGTVPLAQAEDTLREALLAEAQESAWQAEIEAWMQDPAIFRDEALIYAMRGSGA